MQSGRGPSENGSVARYEARFMAILSQNSLLGDSSWFSRNFRSACAPREISPPETVSRHLAARLSEHEQQHRR